MANRGRTLNSEIFCLNDLKEKGSKKLPRAYREFYNEGAMDLITVVDNEKAFDRYKIRPRVLKDVSNLDTSTEIFGTKVTFPFGFSPAATHKLAHPEGEVATSRAAAETGIPMALSAYATCALEDVIAEGKGNPYIMQFSILKNRAISRQILERAEKAGYKAVMMTVDAPMLGRRLNEYRNSFGIPKGMGYPNILPDVDFSNLVDQAADLSYEDSIGWEEAIGWVKSVTKLDIWLKGGKHIRGHWHQAIANVGVVYTAEDMALAIGHGVAGVLISNHGGRQLDGVPATLDALRECVPVAKGKIKIAVDGGIRRGTDIFKAIALGADFCFAGRIPIWGLAYDGAEGVKLAVNLLHDEFKIAMSLAGCKTIKDINKGHLSILQTETGILSKL
ncbi:FMN hydroxy acid dehydrogenase domain-containing protein [Fusarium keratoplasticum]|uniref:FMN hydroxy acid dehydrogenase domain-containing protein n=1 Tax=Fusarium keratoplasticum TaxID=1328300 RepID=A0ACC0QKL0_9HYPO|nr:FMN hydroxy acid dehydrogenase domain-containing protein [Fusarium keratoplasticum]KAI8654851.1 FMN hydroxy acid dehydrogenase domain-containing protein [Fusarium keratoplasticum]KAI8655695.1 FMN hydroxy acid dehydrogenase domain-containing protein [Fusarium keratoplasticum]